MRRVIVPLERMGARITSDEGRPPLTIEGRRRLAAIDFEPEVPSAQVKSAVLLAGLHADGVTCVREPVRTRDHTERALRLFGASVSSVDRTVSCARRSATVRATLVVPGDISSAAFWLVAASALPGSEVTIEDVGLNPTRTGILDVLRRMGAVITLEASGTGDADEPVGTITVRHGSLGNSRSRRRRFRASSTSCPCSPRSLRTAAS